MVDKPQPDNELLCTMNEVGDVKTRRRDEDIKPKMNTVVISLGLLGLIGLN